MFKTKLIAAAMTAAFIAGCSSSHSPEIQKSIDSANGAFEGGYDTQVDKYRPKKNRIGEIKNGFAYHDVNAYTIVEKDKRKLPESFLGDASIKAHNPDAPYTVDEFAALVYESFGVMLDVSSPDLNMLAKEDAEAEVADNEFYNALATPFDAGTTDTTNDPNAVGVAADSAGTYAKGDGGPAKRRVSRDSLRLKPFKYKGNLKGLLDYVSQLNGLKWKYEADANKAFLYGFETQTFRIYDMGDDIKMSSTITTDASQKSGESSGGSKKEFSRKNNIDTWKEMEASIKDLISPEYGKATFDAKTGLITVRDSDYNLTQVKRYVDELNKTTNTEVTIELKVIRVKFNDGDTQGINQNYLNDKLRSNLLGSFDIEIGAGNGSANIAGSAAAFKDLVGGNFVSIANSSHQFLMGFLNTVGTAEVSYSTQVQVLNNDTYNDQNQETEEYIAEIERSSYGESGGRENVTTKRDIAVDGVNLSLRPRISGDEITVAYALNNADFIRLKDGGVEGVKLKTQGALILDNKATLLNGIPKVVKFTHQSENSTSSQGMFDDMLWFLGGNQSRTESKSAIIVTMTAYYNN